MQGTLDECIAKVFLDSNGALATDLEVKYNTIAGWRHQYQLGRLTTEKKREILAKYGYSLKQQEKWQNRRNRSLQQ